MSALACTVEPFAGRASPTVALPAGRPSRVDANPACSSCHGLSLWQALRRRPDPMSVTKITTVGRATEALSPGRCRCDLSVLHGTGVTHQRPARQLRAVHASSSFSDKMAMPVCFRFGGGCREQRVRALSVQPCRHLGVGMRHHQFGHDVGVENEHGCRPWSNCGGSRTGNLKFHTAERLEQFMYRRAQIPGWHGIFTKCGAQDIADLLFHGMSVLGSPHTQPPLQAFIQIADNDTDHNAASVGTVTSILCGCVAITKPDLSQCCWFGPNRWSASLTMGRSRLVGSVPGKLVPTGGTRSAHNGVRRRPGRLSFGTNMRSDSSGHPGRVSKNQDANRFPVSVRPPRFGYAAAVGHRFPAL